MKKLITICLLLATAFSVKSQDMNFDETVKYINDKIICCSENKNNELKAEVNGTLTWGDKTINMFDLEHYKGVDPQLLGDKGIYVYYHDYWSTYYVYLSDGSIAPNLNGFKSQKDAERIYNALQHLRTLCTKTKDPFDK